MKRTKLMIPVLLASVLLLSACSQKAAVETTPAPSATVAPAFEFTKENYPAVMGGAALEPLGEALAAVMLGQSQQEVAGFGEFDSTGVAYGALQSGQCSLVMAMEPVTESGGIDMAEIAKDALVFYVSSGNPVNDLTAEQLRDVYTGAVTNWGELGGEDVDITAFQHNASSGAQAAMKRLLLSGAEPMDAPLDYFPSEEDPAGTVAAVAGFDGSAGAIGFTTWYYASAMGMTEQYEILSVDGVAPSAETIASGEYPLPVSYVAAVASGAGEDSPERLLYLWLQSDAGQSLVDWCGYVPARQG